VSVLRVAAAPCSWGVLEFELEGEPAAAARVLDEMAEAGYAGTELGDWGFLPTSPAELAAALGPRGLEVMAAFVPVALADPAAHADGETRALRAARLLAAVCRSPFVVLADDNGTVPDRVASAGRVRADQALPSEALRTFARGAERIARAVRDSTGVATVFHHHAGGFVETPGEVESLLGLCSAELLGLCLDTGHYAFGGGDPLEAVERHAERIRHVHLKDFDPEVGARAAASGWGYFESVRRGVFCELGRGTVPFARVLDDLGQRGYGGWLVVEQDVLPGMGTPFESAARNRLFLRDLGA
jgi:inosose dehydratase